MFAPIERTTNAGRGTPRPCIIAALIATSCPFLFIGAASSEPVVLSGNVVTRVEEVGNKDAGPHLVEAADGIVIRDSGRNKSIGVEICYPKTQSKFPVIVFSHGSVTSARDYRAMSAFWASHGYVCVLPTHDDAATLHMSPDSKISVFKLAKLAKTSQKTIEERQADIAETIDALPELESKVPALAGKLDVDDIALIGHHAGAFAVQATAGAQVGKTNKAKNSDPRIKAVIAIMGRDWKQPSLGADSLDQVQLPVMLISFSPSGLHLGGARERMYRAMSNAPSGNKYVVTADWRGGAGKLSAVRVAKAIRQSNVELTPFHPLRRIRSAVRGDKSSTSNSQIQENVQVSNVDEFERVGSNLAQTLGLERLLPHGNKGRFNFLMSFTVPFLDGYLKNDRDALQKLSAEDGRCFGNHLFAKIERY